MARKNIGKFITQLRKEANLTQDELGEKIGVTGKSISKWERDINFPDITNIDALATVFNISTYEIFCG